MEKKVKVKVSSTEGLKMSEVSSEGSIKGEGTYTLAYHKKSQDNTATSKNQVSAVMLFGVPIVSLVMDGKERLCLAQISSTLLKEFSYNEIHNRRVALGITCIQCTPVQLEILRRAGAMPVTSRRCGMITRREAERLCQSFLGDHAPPQLPENFAFDVYHECAWGCRGNFVPSRYNSSRAKCIRCSFCQLFFSPNKFIFHSHRLPDSRYVQPDAANFNSWRRHLRLCGDPPEDVSSLSPTFKHSTPSGDTNSHISPKHSFPPKDLLTPTSSSHCDDVVATAQIVHAWEDVKAMFNGGTRKRLLAAHSVPSSHSSNKRSSPPKISPPGSYVTSSGGSPPCPELSDRPVDRATARAPSEFGNRSRVDSSASFMSPITNSPPFSSGRIWNPGVSNLGDKGRLEGNQMHALPLAIHPLSIPWLRRPPFPLGYNPFEPNCKYLAEGSLFPEPGGNNRSAAAYSAFKPVRQQTTGTTAEQIFSTWLNTSALHGNFIQIPEDLSLGSGNTSSVNSASPLYLAPPRTIDNCKYIPSGILSKDAKSRVPALETMVESCSTEYDPGTQVDSPSSCTSDEETVDVESTDSERKNKEVRVQSLKRCHSHSDPDRYLQSEDDQEVNSSSNIGIEKPPSPNHGHGRYSSNSNGLRHSQKSRKKNRLWDFDRTRCTSPP